MSSEIPRLLIDVVSTECFIEEYSFGGLKERLKEEKKTYIYSTITPDSPKQLRYYIRLGKWVKNSNCVRMSS